MELLLKHFNEQLDLIITLERPCKYFYSFTIDFASSYIFLTLGITVLSKGCEKGIGTSGTAILLIGSFKSLNAS